jgi:prophage regulatory protein
MSTTSKTLDSNTAQAADAETAAMTAAKPARFIGKPEVLDRVYLSYTTVWELMRVGKFPRSRAVGGRSVWVESEIEEWIANRPVRRLKGDS